MGELTVNMGLLELISNALCKPVYWLPVSQGTQGLDMGI